MRLKKYLRYGQKLSCENEGCAAKFTTALGYLSHKKICGVKEEDREKFVCEECGKEYTSMPGLSYHLKAKHTQVMNGQTVIGTKSSLVLQTLLRNCKRYMPLIPASLDHSSLLEGYIFCYLLQTEPVESDNIDNADKVKGSCRHLLTQMNNRN